jgi:hypothetical protein
MTIILEPYNTRINFITLLAWSFIFSVGFWYFRDVGAVISNASGNGVSDLSRYLAHYDALTTDRSTSGGLKNDYLYTLIVMAFSKLGFSFNFFVFFIINIYYIVFAFLSKKFLKTNNLFFTLIVLLILSYWLVPLATVALRQGLAILMVAIFFFLIERRSLWLDLLFLFIISGVHLSAVALLPFILLRSFVSNRLLLLDSILVLVFMLYAFNIPEFLVEYVLLFLEFFGIEARSLISDNGYKVGFSILKSLAFMTPVLLFRVPMYFGLKDFLQLKELYFYYVFFGIIGMLFSGLPYHDRIFLYAWGFSPILLTSFFILFFNTMNYKKISD